MQPRITVFNAKEFRAWFVKNRSEKRIVEAYPPSTKRMLFRWILRGKQATTREKRVKQVVASAKKDKRHSLRPATKQQGQGPTSI